MHEPTRRATDAPHAADDAALLAQLRRRLDEQRVARERASHRMRCPRCGGHLVEHEHHGVKIDTCPDCNGTWLDAGELEQLERLDHPSVLRFIGDVIGGFRR